MPINLSSQKIKGEWLDYNNHLNVANYILIFNQFGDDILVDMFDMGEHSAKTSKRSTMIVETHINYYQELLQNDEININLVYFDHDNKRLQYKMEMIHKEKKYLASSIEILALYVDLNRRKVIKFEEEKVKMMDDFINKNKSQFNNKDLKFTSKLKK